MALLSSAERGLWVRSGEVGRWRSANLFQIHACMQANLWTRLPNHLNFNDRWFFPPFSGGHNPTVKLEFILTLISDGMYKTEWASHGDINIIETHLYFSMIAWLFWVFRIFSAVGINHITLLYDSYKPKAIWVYCRHPPLCIRKSDSSIPAQFCAWLGKRAVVRASYPSGFLVRFTAL